MRNVAFVLSLLLLVIISGCGVKITEPDVKPSAGNITYSGTIPCSDCRSKQLTVTLFDNKTFRMKRVSIGVQGGGNKVEYDLGRWSRKGNRLVLDNGQKWPLQFRYVSGKEIKMLDQRGNEIVSKLDYSLRKRSFVDMLAGPMTMNGMFLSTAGTSTFKECKTGKSYPLVFESSDASVKKRYLALRPGAGKPVLATLKGRFVMRKPSANAAPREHIIVQKFKRFSPGGTCKDPGHPAVMLRGTSWRLISIAGSQEVLKGVRKVPNLVLSLYGGSIKGFSGCNSLMGTYTKGTTTLSFSRLSTTRMACPGKSGEVEQAFLGALRKASGWKITGKTLELFDKRNRLLMRLKAG
ncbi:META domain-containing protein [Prosthecochloris sp. SCSIO W1103]|uniref:META domain-containing protein n=1 Tax=Prosthecochloris sp. SCSIO W1103 TaxID=2992244 RepID=UPI00223E1E8F|nr:META domain-containing protein [Prosthecochloris sp. SCSIO W1103]UZJ37788.1 META domain-containing protein [Prosthecochloris sp. SCSIO W1103]